MHPAIRNCDKEERRKLKAGAKDYLVGFNPDVASENSKSK